MPRWEWAGNNFPILVVGTLRVPYTSYGTRSVPTTLEQWNIGKLLPARSLEGRPRAQRSRISHPGARPAVARWRDTFDRDLIGRQAGTRHRLLASLETAGHGDDPAAIG